MGKKLDSCLFILAGTVVDILLIFAVIALLLVLLYLCRGAVPDGAMPLVLLVAVLGGFAVGMVLYQRLALWVIRRFKLEDRLDPILKQQPTRKG